MPILEDQAQSTDTDQIAETNADFLSRLDKLKKETRRICDQYPSVCFFRKFGKTITISKDTVVDPKSDIDLRCIFDDQLSTQDRDAIKKQLSEIMWPTPVEVQFTEIKNYKKGIVGNEGGYTSSQLMANRALYNPEVEISLQHSGLIMIYYLVTCEELSHTREEVLAAFGTDCDPQVILDSIQIDNESGDEWANISYLSFLDNFEKQHEYTFDYALRLAKYAVRIAFCTMVAQAPAEELPEIKQLMISEIKNANGANDEAFWSILQKKTPSWFKPWDQIALKIGAMVRNNDKWVLQNLIQDSATKSDPSLKPEKVYHFFCNQLEQLIFSLANYSGGHARREADAFDPITRGSLEFFLKEVLTKRHPDYKRIIPDGENFIHEGLESDAIFFIPKFRTNKSGEIVKNGNGVKLDFPTKSGEPDAQILRDAGRMAGEFGVLLDIKRTTSVSADGDLEVYRIPKSYILMLFNSPSILEQLRHPETIANKEDAMTLHLYVLFLKYFSYEFLSSVRDIEILSTNNQSSQETLQQLKQGNPLDEFLPDNLGSLIEDLLISKAKIGSYETIKCDTDMLLFSPEKPENGYAFIALSSDEEFPVVANNFKGNADTQIAIGPNVIFGDSAFLRLRSRSATVTARAGSVILKFKVEEFERLTAHNTNTNSEYSEQELLFAIAATNLGRIKRSLEKNGKK